MWKRDESQIRALYTIQVLTDPSLPPLYYCMSKKKRLYTKNVPYIGMRLLSIVCGVGLIPISYLTIKNSGHSTQAAIICAILVTFENALITQSRFILLDAPMMLFMGYTILAWINFYNYRNRPFTRGWWTWLIQTGVGLFLSSRCDMLIQDINLKKHEDSVGTY